MTPKSRSMRMGATSANSTAAAPSSDDGSPASGGQPLAASRAGPGPAGDLTTSSLRSHLTPRARFAPTQGATGIGRVLPDERPASGQPFGDRRHPTPAHRGPGPTSSAGTGAGVAAVAP